MMRIYSKVVIDIASGRTLEAESYDYRGPLALCGGPKIKTASPPPPTEEELANQQLDLALKKAQLGDLGFEYFTDDKGKLQLRKRELTPEEQTRQGKLQEMEDLAFSQLTGKISPEQEALIEKSYGRAESEGNEDIKRFMIEQAGARGMELGDTPLTREIARAKADLTLGLGSAKAASKLNLGQMEREFGLSLGSFREGLRNQSFTNRLNIGGQMGQTGVGFMGARGGLKPSFSQPTQSPMWGLMGAGLGALGGFFGGR
jgi:hypothetical protein